MDIIYNILVALICLIFGYLIGSVSFAIIIGKVFYHQDPRELGSKNAGGTNAGRIWGKKVGLLVVIKQLIISLLHVLRRYTFHGADFPKQHHDADPVCRKYAVYH